MPTAHHDTADEGQEVPMGDPRPGTSPLEPAPFSDNVKASEQGQYHSLVWLELRASVLLPKLPNARVLPQGHEEVSGEWDSARSPSAQHGAGRWAGGSRRLPPPPCGRRDAGSSVRAQLASPPGGRSGFSCRFGIFGNPM